MRDWSDDQLDTLDCMLTTCLRHTRREYIFPIIVQLVSHMGLSADRAKRLYHELVDVAIPDADDIMRQAGDEYEAQAKAAPCFFAEFRRRTEAGSTWLCTCADAEVYGQSVGIAYCHTCKENVGYDG